MLRETVMYANHGTCEKLGEWYHNFAPSAEVVRMHGHKDRIAKVRVRDLREGETCRYWAWWDAKDEEFRFVYYARGLVNMCFPYGPEVEEARGRGKVTNVMVEEV